MPPTKDTKDDTTTETKTPGNIQGKDSSDTPSSTDVTVETATDSDACETKESAGEAAGDGADGGVGLVATQNAFDLDGQQDTGLLPKTLVGEIFTKVRTDSVTAPLVGNVPSCESCPVH